MRLNFHLVDNDKGNVDVTVSDDSRQYTVNYPCELNYSCTNYKAIFPPGIYQIELYGASSGYKYITSAKKEDLSGCKHDPELISEFGGNVECENITSMGGAGGYTSGILTLKEKTNVYIAIGGMGEYTSKPEYNPQGGYNGGGSGGCYYNQANVDMSGAASGGGATDVRLLKNDLFHRVIVSGGGGGSDNCNLNNEAKGNDDGTGGAGGGQIAQGFWINGVYKNKEANQTFGFSFGYGESSKSDGISLHPDGEKPKSTGADKAGAGAGWYGGFASQNANGGAGGGSSFVLTKDSILPIGNIDVYDDKYEKVKSGAYAFTNNSPYCLSSPRFIQGIWAGNGKARITILSFLVCTQKISRKVCFIPIIVIFIVIK